MSESETEKIWTFNIRELIIQAKALGFDYVDIYVPDKESGEVVAFTFSKSEKYSEEIQKIEVSKDE